MKINFKLLFLILFALIFSGQLSGEALAEAEPQLPQTYINTDYVEPTGKTIEVKAGSNLQAAIDQAAYGDEIVLQAGATFTGAYVLKKKSGSGWITLRTADLQSLPKPGERINPSKDTGSMAKILSPGLNEPALRAEKGASGYRIVGIEFGKSSPSSKVTNLIIFGDGIESSINDLPNNIILDRIYAHGDSTSDLRRCVALNGVALSIIDSYISECHERGADSQAIGGWNGPGPFKIVNNYLEAASENIMFGGADPSINGLIPSDIVIRRNHFYKPLEWRGKGWVVKNLIETKNAKRVLVDGNLFENSWPDGQTGTAILVKSANQDGKCSWCVSSDILFSNNIVRNVSEGVRINGAEGSPLPPVVARIKFQNMIFEDVEYKLFQIFNGAKDITFENVSAYSPESILFGDAGNGSTNPGLVIRNSVLERGKYGIGAGSEEGKIYLDKWFPGSLFEGNVIVNSSNSDDASISKIYLNSKVVKKNQVPSGVGAEIGEINAAMKGSVISAPTNPKQTRVSNSRDTQASETTTSNSKDNSQARSSGGGSRSSSGLSARNSLQLSIPASNIPDIQSKIALLLAQLSAIQGNSPSRQNNQALGSSTFNQDLSLGNSGPEVVSLQQMLVSKGFLQIPPGTAYGYFGPLTRNAVINWQASRGLPATGYFGPLSRAAAQN